jgi:hypothetical protein
MVSRISQATRPESFSCGWTFATAEVTAPRNNRTIAGDFWMQIDFANAIIGPGVDQVEFHVLIVFADLPFVCKRAKRPGETRATDGGGVI